MTSTLIPNVPPMNLETLDHRIPTPTIRGIGGYSRLEPSHGEVITDDTILAQVNSVIPIRQRTIRDGQIRQFVGIAHVASEGKYLYTTVPSKGGWFISQFFFIICGS